jgi:hypothetical protein
MQSAGTGNQFRIVAGKFLQIFVLQDAWITSTQFAKNFLLRHSSSTVAEESVQS